MHPGGFSAAKYIEALRFAWDCLQLLEREGSFATFDTQAGPWLDLHTSSMKAATTSPQRF